MAEQNTNIQGGSISTDPNAMTIGEYVLENIRRLNEAGNNESLPERERAIRKAQATELQNFYNTQIKGVRSVTGGQLENQYANRMNDNFKSMLEKASGIKFGELQGQENQTQIELPETVKQAMQSFVGSDQNKVANSNVLSKQVNNIHKFDNATAAGQGRNTEAAKQAQEAQRDSRKLVNSVKQEGVRDNPVRDLNSDRWYRGSTGGGATGGRASRGGDKVEESAGEEVPNKNNLNKLLLADILMTGVRNALHYRPAFRTAYGEDIEGRDFGTEKSLAMKLAEENMKRGLERTNSKKDYETQQQAEIDATKQKGKDTKYRQARQDLTMDVSPVTTTNSNQYSDSNIFGSTAEANSTATTKYNDIQASR